MTQDQLSSVARQRECYATHSSHGQLGQQLRRIYICAGALPGRLVQQRRVPPAQQPLTGRRTVLIHQMELQASQLTGQPQRAAYGCRTADEAWVRSIVCGDSSQPPDDVCCMRTEHAPVGVHLVYDHILEAAEKLGPGMVIRQYPHMQHVWIGQHHLCLLFHLPTDRLGSVTVIGGSSKAASSAEIRQLAQLILSQRFRGVDQQRPTGRSTRKRLYDGDQIA